MRGVELRVGSKSRPDQAIIIEAMKLLMKKMEVAVNGNVSMLEVRDLTKKGAYFMSCFVESLRGARGSRWMQQDCDITLGKEGRDP